MVSAAVLSDVTDGFVDGCVDGPVGGCVDGPVGGCVDSPVGGSIVGPVGGCVVGPVVDGVDGPVVDGVDGPVGSGVVGNLLLRSDICFCKSAYRLFRVPRVAAVRANVIIPNTVITPNTISIGRVEDPAIAIDICVTKK